MTDVVIGSDYVSGKLTTLDVDGILKPDQITQLKQWGESGALLPRRQGGRSEAGGDPRGAQDRVLGPGVHDVADQPCLVGAVAGLLLGAVGVPLPSHGRRRGGGGLMAIGRSKAKVYVESETRVTFADVAGIDEAKEELQEVVEFLRTPERFRRLGGKIPKGVLLVGAPGTGKTLLARAVAGEAKVPFFSMSGSEFVEMFVGVGAARVRDLFEQAKQKAPCIVFIDELDALGKSRSINPLGTHDEREQTLNQLLVEMDGFDPSVGVIIMAATNRPEILDAALLRAGRFDRHVALDRPDVRGREAILRVHTRNVKLGAGRRRPGGRGAHARVRRRRSGEHRQRGGPAGRAPRRTDVTMQDFDDAIDRIVAGLEKKTRVMSKREKEIVAYHESGHALVASLLPNMDPVRKISIIPRGIAALGYTQQLPTEDRYLMTRSELEDRLCVLLGGRVAEELVFGDISTGAQDDLQKATDIAAQHGDPVRHERDPRPADVRVGAALAVPRWRRMATPQGLQRGEGGRHRCRGGEDPRARPRQGARACLTERRAILDQAAHRLAGEGSDGRRRAAGAAGRRTAAGAAGRELASSGAGGIFWQKVKPVTLR